MQNLRETDGTPTHRRAVRFHMAKCRTGGTPLHTQLREEATAVYNDLKLKERAQEDAEDDLVDASAEVETTEIASRTRSATSTTISPASIATIRAWPREPRSFPTASAP